jgi:hypothetical protein
MSSENFKSNKMRRKGTSFIANPLPLDSSNFIE